MVKGALDVSFKFRNTACPVLFWLPFSLDRQKQRSFKKQQRSPRYSLPACFKILILAKLLDISTYVRVTAQNVLVKPWWFETQCSLVQQLFARGVWEASCIHGSHQVDSPQLFGTKQRQMLFTGQAQPPVCDLHLLLCGEHSSHDSERGQKVKDGRNKWTDLWNGKTLLIKKCWPGRN